MNVNVNADLLCSRKTETFQYVEVRCPYRSLLPQPSSNQVLVESSPFHLMKPSEAVLDDLLKTADRHKFHQNLHSFLYRSTYAKLNLMKKPTLGSVRKSSKQVCRYNSRFLLVIVSC